MDVKIIRLWKCGSICANSKNRKEKQIPHFYSYSFKTSSLYIFVCAIEWSSCGRKINKLNTNIFSHYRNDNQIACKMRSLTMNTNKKMAIFFYRRQHYTTVVHLSFLSVVIFTKDAHKKKKETPQKQPH